VTTVTDRSLDERLREHFGEVATRHAVPDFEAMLANAESNHPLRRTGARYAGLVALAAAVVAVVWLWRSSAPPMPEAPAGDAALLAQLSSTTYWRAPSDRWLARPRSDLLDLPRFDGVEPPEEIETWF